MPGRKPDIDEATNEARQRSSAIVESPKRRWRRSMPPVGRMYQSFTSFASPNRNSSDGGSNNPTFSDEDSPDVQTGEEKDQEHDLAIPCGMAKSIVGLLTTASVYAGMGDIEQAESICEDEDSDASDGSEGTNRSEALERSESCEDSEAPKVDKTDLEDVSESSRHSITANGADDDAGADDSTTISETPSQISKKDTLFEISVVPNSDLQSVVTSSSKSRQSKIYRKLISKFGLNEEEDQFVLTCPCWLLKDLLIQGHIVLTTRHLLFFAFLPKSTGATKMSGNLATVSGRLRGRWTRHWAVLKDHTLSFYNSPKDLYFPILTIDLRYATKVELSKHDGEATGDFRIFTEGKTFKFRADSNYAARSWCSALKKQVFATQNSENDSLSVKIPLANIIDMDEQLVVAQSVTLRIRVLESSQSFAVDDYFFMFLNKKDLKLKETINTLLLELDRVSPEELGNAAIANETAESALVDESTQKDSHPGRRGRSSSTSKKLFKRVLSPMSRSPGHSLSMSISIPFSTKSSHAGKGRLRSVTDSFSRKMPTGNVEEHMSVKNPADVEDEPSKEDQDAISKETTAFESMPDSTDEGKGRNFRLASWTPKPIKNMGNMWNAHPVHYQTKGPDMFPGDDPYLAAPKDQSIASKRFRSHFSLDSTEFLHAAYYTYLNKNIPVYGKLYLGTSVVCFRSLIPGTKTKMILPIKDMENCYKERGFRFGYFGLVLVIHGHEELFFEFSLQNSRDDAEFAVLKLLDVVKPRLNGSPETKTDTETGNAGKSSGHNDQLTEAAKLRMLEDKINAEGYDLPMMIEENPYFKTSITPKKSYKFGLLTIGSRGDVQPYIALGKGLVREGHKVTIITHAEFGEWIESYGLGFIEIAGNPAALMSLMVQHGSMNVGLLRDASSQFRGWIKDLLDTSWSACQGLDILIESPSAMAGIHIAEALKIPYFRAFTMPWTRTRSYPHAFIVPDQKRGGNYNYFTHVLFENIFWKGIGGQINKWRVEKLGLEKTNLYMMQQNKVPFLYSLSPSIFPPSVDFSEWVKVTGYWFLDSKDDYSPPVELSEFIQRARALNKKLVYIGFGSIVINDPKEMTRAVVDAILDADVFCILNKGWSDRLDNDNKTNAEPELFPDCIYNSGSVPHDWLFPKVDAAVHHGGSGTTGATLRAGLPTVIKPFFGDQFFFAGRIEDIGAGISLKKLNSKSLSRALKEVTTNSRIINKAKQIQQEISKEDGVSVAISCIYAELAYARSLVVAKAKGTQSDAKESSSTEENTWFLV
ncbi:LAQU0S15e01706g1_1 [Lachancea quebecensis]|uniref:Sterol 3-beta-glucosyltransferase n=1 Tax=Lachancea quebecensis TaxID=1654605 RepID=A0A0N7MM75_9SACH|nr:LAQU0S15e01706g1_1 [Lachancea quebecensis]